MGKLREPVVISEPEVWEAVFEAGWGEGLPLDSAVMRLLAEKLGCGGEFPRFLPRERGQDER